MNGLTITSEAFEQGGMIPKRFTGKGEDISPPIRISGVDPRARTIALIADDPDIPIPFLSFTHWVLYNIPVDVTGIPEGVPRGETIPALGDAMQGQNSFRKNAYIGPKPPFGVHRYRFSVYTLDAALELKPGAGRRQLERTMKGHILQTGLLVGRFGVP